jgi:hypothetical protein
MSATRYRTADGKVVPSVTTLCGNIGWNRNALTYWANTEGLAGRTLDDARVKADIGTVAHALIEADISGEGLDTSKIVPAMLDKAKGVLGRWREWKEQHVQAVLLSESPMVSESLHYGGRLDMVFTGMNGNTWLLDVKTGGLYAEALVQLAGYVGLVEENTDHRIDEIALLRIPQESLAIATMEFPWTTDDPTIAAAVRTFAACRQLHEDHKILKRAV